QVCTACVRWIGVDNGPPGLASWYFDYTHRHGAGSGRGFVSLRHDADARRGADARFQAHSHARNCRERRRFDRSVVRQWERSSGCCRQLDQHLSRRFAEHTMRTGPSNAGCGAFGGAGADHKLASSRRRRRTFGRDPAAVSADDELGSKLILGLRLVFEATALARQGTRRTAGDWGRRAQPQPSRGDVTVDLLLSSIWLVVVIWLIARAFQQRNLLPRLEPDDPPPADRAPKIAAIVPARDEAANIDRCLRSLVAQTYPASRLRIVVIDVPSRDHTFAIASALAKTYPQLTVLRSPPLPPHWVGKSHACWIGARAVEEDTNWLCFVDADVWGEPALIASAVAAASADALDLLSLAPRQELQSFAERLVMPCGLYLL